jgi:hypothetical protein
LETGVIKFPSLGIAALTCILSAVQTPALAIAPDQEIAWGNASIIELFTSQGCASCPEADQLLEQLSHRPDVIALSFPVSYWDYLGWKDTLARPENADRQRKYAKVMGDGEVYTPQAIVNGVRNCVGSDRNEIESAVEATAPVVGRFAVPIILTRDNGKLVVDVAGAPEGSKYRKGKVWVATVRQPLSVPIQRGENAGAVVTYTNVVRKLTEAGEWEGAPTSYTLPLNTLAADGESLVVFLQAELQGRIVAATRAGE